MSNNILFLSNIKGDFEKIIELNGKLEKTGKKFDTIILIGECFSVENNFSKLNLLKELKTQFIIFDSSKIASILKSKIKYDIYDYSNNIKILGRSGVFSINKDLNIAYINGKENNESFDLGNNKIYTGEFFIYNDIKNLINEANKKENIDIFLFSNFPYLFFEEMKNNNNSILYNNKIKINKEKIINNISIISNNIINEFCPRYVITSVDDFYYERKPYFNRKGFVSRFIHLSYYLDKKNLKEKSLYGISLKKFEQINETNLKEDNINENPFNEKNTFVNLNDGLNLKKNIEKNILELILNSDNKNNEFPFQIKITHLDKKINDIELNNFLIKFGEILFLRKNYNKRGDFLCEAFVSFKNPLINNKLITEDKVYKINNKRVFFEKIENNKLYYSKCKFCFDNSEIEKELILHTFNNFYLAYSKGPINNFHFLILPKKHYSSYFSLPKILKEEFKEILNTIINFLKLHSLDYILYEKNLPFDNEIYLHMCINIIGIEKDYMIGFQEIFKNNFPNFYNINESYDEENIFSLDKYENKSNFYYYINGSKGYKIGFKEIRLGYFIEVPNNIKDFKDYPRLIICKLIDKEKNIYWKNCLIDNEFFKKLKYKINEYFK